MTATRIHALHVGGDLTDWAAFDPFDLRVGTKIYNPYFAYLVEHPEGRILFDTGPHPDLGVTPEARLGPAAASFEVRLAPDEHLAARLAGVGCRPEDIDRVVVSHLHFDHAGGLQLFDDTPIIVSGEELEFARRPPVYQASVYTAADFAHVTRWEVVGDGHDVFGDGSVLLVATPGHSRGHQSLLVRLPTRTVFLLGDAAYDLQKMRERALPGLLWSPDAMVASWARIEAIERDENALLVVNHELDFEHVVPAVYA